MTQTVTSADGSTIAYERTGTGPVVILVGGAFSVRQSVGALAPLLSAHFSVIAYDRRSRGDSTAVTPYSPQREVEDLAALIEASGGSACVYGHSSGAILALHAAASGLPITRLAAFEPPYTTDIPGSGSVAVWRERVQAALDAGDRDGASAIFMQGTGMPEAAIDAARQEPWWSGMLDVAHTLAHDLDLLGDGSVPIELFTQIAVPTLLLYGGDSPAWAGDAVSTAAEAIPGATKLSLPGQTHNSDPAVVVPVLIEFFG